jgi:type II secretory pathway pseudopilin PulG
MPWIDLSAAPLAATGAVVTLDYRRRALALTQLLWLLRQFLEAAARWALLYCHLVWAAL